MQYEYLRNRLWFTQDAQQNNTQIYKKAQNPYNSDLWLVHTFSTI